MVIERSFLVRNKDTGEVHNVQGIDELARTLKIRLQDVPKLRLSFVDYEDYVVFETTFNKR